MGVLPDGIRMLDRLTGAELLRYTGLLRGMAETDVVSRTGDLLDALGARRCAGHARRRLLQPACARRSGSPAR